MRSQSRCAGVDLAQGVGDLVQHVSLAPRWPPPQQISLENPPGFDNPQADNSRRCYSPIGASMPGRLYFLFEQLIQRVCVGGILGPDLCRVFLIVTATGRYSPTEKARSIAGGL